MKKNLLTDEQRQRVGRSVSRVVAVMLAVSVVVVVVLGVVMFQSLVTQMLEEQCVSGTNMLAYELSRTTGEEDLNPLLDELKSRMNCEFTICKGDVRTYTTVVQDGQRVVGTRMADDVASIVLRQGKSFVGTATIVDEDYLCSYIPTRDSQGQVDGVLFAGISKAAASRQTRLVLWTSAIVGAAAIAISIVIMVLYLRKKVSIPLAAITTTAERLERGELKAVSSENAIELSDDEIGRLSRIFDGTVGRIRAYIGEIDKVLNAIADGDLTHSAEQDYVGDFSSIKHSLEGIVIKLNDTMSQIMESSEQVSSGANQVSNSAQALAQGATEQASAVEELAATITEISQNAKRTAQNAEEAGESVNLAGSHLQTSVEYVQHLNTAMDKIANSSEQIGKIIATIENIAFQTNILALNAAVEAARAGIAGKGFAVVADEVRNLAAKSDEAAKATKELIESSMTAVIEGSQAVEMVTEALEKTSMIAGGVTSKMTGVVQAVEEQTLAIAQVTEGIDQISAVVQTNSATSEECAAASEELSSQADLLRRLMESFRLKQGGRW